MIAEFGGSEKMNSRNGEVEGELWQREGERSKAILSK